MRNKDSEKIWQLFSENTIKEKKYHVHLKLGMKLFVGNPETNGSYDPNDPGTHEGTPFDGVYHKVVEGDNVWNIAKKYNLLPHWKRLVDWNKLKVTVTEAWDEDDARDKAHSTAGLAAFSSTHEDDGWRRRGHGTRCY